MSYNSGHLVNNMIKIQRTPCPIKLTEEVKLNLTQEYETTGKNVWNKEYIKVALFKMSNGKCIFCECKLNEESKYMEVEHFYPKHEYPLEVVDWNNLLPICKRCNVNKGGHDTKKEPIINPTIDDPKKHLHMSNYRYIGKDRLGKDTIDLLCLNEFDQLIAPRVQIGNQVLVIIEKIHSDLLKLGELEEASGMEIRKIINRLRNLLNSCLPDKVYSTTCSYALLTDTHYNEIKNILTRAKKWDDSLDGIEISVFEHSLINKFEAHGAVSSL
ncbi:HNH endonuclease [Paenibacillus taiwanensis]|uniref:HNH endonuclease n=1 Tax=Paenibacillus taiwanensis TaxID=401638 RepID=UPI000404B932|nr:HNH endonuclease [Paenibacillus taiwanensis]